MNEQELKNFIIVYQQKLNELIAQNIALEAKLMNANQVIESLTKKVNELNVTEQSPKSKRVNKNSDEF
jgi:phage shock protein A